MVAQGEFLEMLWQACTLSKPYTAYMVYQFKIWFATPYQTASTCPPVLCPPFPLLSVPPVPLSCFPILCPLVLGPSPPLVPIFSVSLFPGPKRSELQRMEQFKNEAEEQPPSRAPASQPFGLGGLGMMSRLPGREGTLTPRVCPCLPEGACPMRESKSRTSATWRSSPFPTKPLEGSR